MTTNISGSAAPTSATIYTFPPRGRFALRIEGDGYVPATNAQMPRGAKLVAGTGWYHDAAIKDEHGSEN